MALKHSVYDTDAHFKIDPITRTIKCEAPSKTVLIQGDHNSERFTFELARTIDGHDMSLCDVVQVHYINIDSRDKNFVSKDAHDLDDLQISPESDDVVIFSWLIDGNATKYAGTLNFLIKFKCIGDDGNPCYVWNTATSSNITISSGIDNGEYITVEYSDILELWRHELIEAGSSVSDEQIAQAVEDYLVEHPVEVSGVVKTVNGVAPDENGNVEIEVPESGGNAEDGFSPIAKVEQTATGAIVSITDKTGTTTATIINGKDGQDYVLTPADKSEIAEMAAELVDVPESADGSGVYILSDGETITDAPADASVVIDPNGEPDVIPGGGIDVEGAVPGQTIVVKAVDANGRPTEWEAVDFPEGGGASSWNELTDKPFYREYQKVIIYSATDLVPDPDMGMIIVNEFVPIVDGQEYTVNWNGVDYTCICLTMDGDAFILGNMAVADGEDTGEPFCIIAYNSQGMTVMAPLDGSESATVSISGNVETVHELDEKYIAQALRNSEQRAKDYSDTKHHEIYIRINTNIQLGINEDTCEPELYDALFNNSGDREVQINVKILDMDYVFYTRGYLADNMQWMAFLTFEPRLSEIYDTNDILGLRICVTGAGRVLINLRQLHSI